VEELSTAAQVERAIFTSQASGKSSCASNDKLLIITGLFGLSGIA
jgi:hypothetical protein